MIETIRKIGTAFRLPGTLETFDIITNGNINTPNKPLCHY